MKFTHMIAAVLALLFTVSAASAADRTVNVKFPRGASGTTIDGAIKGYDGIRYVVGVSAGQKMSVELDTDNASSYFNITAPGASEALFNGSISGTSTSFDVPSSGNYVINVYLMRNAARRNETATFELSIYVEGKAAAVAPKPRPGSDVADGLAGGPDYWQVHGLSAGDTLNVRASASTGARVLGRLAEGDVIRNLGCQMSDGRRWCRISTTRNVTGWVAGRYLHESFADTPRAVRPSQPVTLPSYPIQAQPLPQPVRDSTISVADMPRYCRGEASAKFGVRPQEITTNAAFRSGNLYYSQGYFEGSNGTQFFNCYFQTDGSFIGVN